jgi:putative methyltransferase
MSLYFEAASAITNKEKVGGSLKSRIYGNKTSKHPPAQVYALVSEATKWSSILTEVIEKSGLLKVEKKVRNYTTPRLTGRTTLLVWLHDQPRPEVENGLALIFVTGTQLSDVVVAVLLVHDLLLAKRGVSTPQNHPLNLAVSRHKSRLMAELTRIRVRRGFPSIDSLRQSIQTSASPSNDAKDQKFHRHARWVRINTLATSLEAQLQTTFVSFDKAAQLGDVLDADRLTKIYCVDENISNLIALPPGFDVSRMEAYKTGELIVQDKASCFPAFLLDPSSLPDGGDSIDACAAPGNKTTHLAALKAEEGLQKQAKNNAGQKSVIFAFEKDRIRTETLRKMVTQAGANKLVTICGASDFMQAQPDDERYGNVTSLLLDPSCSGSGIVGRDDAATFHLPGSPAAEASRQSQSLGRKRKRSRSTTNVVEKAVASSPVAAVAADIQLEAEPAEQDEGDDQAAEDQAERLAALSDFQLRLLQHAMKFPAARRIVYSTCSVHDEENEGVVAKALGSEVAKDRGWKLLPREQQVGGLRAWSLRGNQSPFAERSELLKAGHNPIGLAEACIRCEKGTATGTMGFFVAAFTRDLDDARGAGTSHQMDRSEEDDEDEWNGIVDSE